MAQCKVHLDTQYVGHMLLINDTGHLLRQGCAVTWHWNNNSHQQTANLSKDVPNGQNLELMTLPAPPLPPSTGASRVEVKVVNCQVDPIALR